MQRFSNVLILALLAAAVSGIEGIGLPVARLVPLAPPPAVAQSAPPPAVAQSAPPPAVAQSAPIPVSLPEIAVITLKNGGERSGRVVGIDSQNQVLLLQRGDDSSSTPLNEIAKVVYDPDAPFYRAQGPIVIRGEQASPDGESTTWSNVPLSSFSVNDGSRGQAVVMLESVLTSSELRGVRAVASSSTYVMDEMQFNLQDGTMTVSVTPY